MNRYSFESKKSWAGVMPGYNIIDAKRGRSRPIASTDSVSDAELIVDALNTRALLVDSVDR